MPRCGIVVTKLNKLGSLSIRNVILCQDMKLYYYQESDKALIYRWRFFFCSGNFSNSSVKLTRPNQR